MHLGFVAANWSPGVSTPGAKRMGVMAMSWVMDGWLGAALLVFFFLILVASFFVVIGFVGVG